MKRIPILRKRNPEGVAIDHDQTTAGATLSGLRLSQMTM